MRILHFLNSGKLSGAENVVADICMMFENKYEMAYCSVDGPIKEALKDRDVNFIPLKEFTYSGFRRVLKNYNPDIIHAHDIGATILATLASGSIPLVSHLHVNKDEMTKISLKSVLYMLAAKKVNKIIVVAESCLNDYIFKRSIIHKTIVLRNIVNLSRIVKLTSKDSNEYNFDFVFLGRLVYQKNPECVARVASEVLKKIPYSFFGIIGEGDSKECMERIFFDEGVSDRAVFVGSLPYPYKALKQAKCFLMCSRNEGTPIAALEAMAFGLPIVSTPVDGMINLVEDRKTGFLSSEESVLVDSLVSLLTDTPMRNRMREETLRKFKKINNEEAYISVLETLYASLSS